MIEKLEEIDIKVNEILEKVRKDIPAMKELLKMLI